MRPSARLKELGLTLPTLAAPIGAYVPALRVGDLVYTSGQLPFENGKLPQVGAVGRELTLEQGAAAARTAALNALAAAASAAGGIDAIARIVRVCVYVASAPGFTDQPKVANGASHLLGELFGDAGKHVRSAVGVNELPMGAPVEVELTCLVGR
ncbi:MAG TPA: RidA family protein [Phycisphaerae bacterium]|jgi:enamine deaminase RidA (YjgF/YER057c/UK114 family)